MQNATTMMFINALILLMGPPIFIFLSPLLLRCFYMGCYLMKGTIDMYFNSISLANNYSKKLKKVVQSQGWYSRQVALLEVIVGIILIPCIILLSIHIYIHSYLYNYQRYLQKYYINIQSSSRNIINHYLLAINASKIYDGS